MLLKKCSLDLHLFLQKQLTALRSYKVVSVILSLLNLVQWSPKDTFQVAWFIDEGLNTLWQPLLWDSMALTSNMVITRWYKCSMCDLWSYKRFKLLKSPCKMSVSGKCEMISFKAMAKKVVNVYRTANSFHWNYLYWPGAS